MTFGLKALVNTWRCYFVFLGFFFFNLHFVPLSKLSFPSSQTVWTHVKGKLCPKNLTIPAWLLTKREEINWFLQLVPRSCFHASDTGVTAITAEPNLPGLPYNTDLSLLMKCSNTRPLTSSPSPATFHNFAPLRVKEHRVVFLTMKSDNFHLPPVCRTLV